MTWAWRRTECHYYRWETSWCHKKPVRYFDVETDEGQVVCGFCAEHADDAEEHLKYTRHKAKSGLVDVTEVYIVMNG